MVLSLFSFTPLGLIVGFLAFIFLIFCFLSASYRLRRNVQRRNFAEVRYQQRLKQLAEQSIEETEKGK